MGNICFTGLISRPYLDPHTMTVKQKLVCSRCHRTDHNSYYCYDEYTYEDGSYINYCNKCRRVHQNGCPSDNVCVIC